MNEHTQDCPACDKNVTASQTKVGDVELLCAKHTQEINGYMDKVLDKHTQDVEEIMKELAQTISKGAVTGDWQKHDTIKKLNKAYLSQAIEVIGEDRHSDGIFCKTECICFWRQANKERAELRTKFIKLWGKD